eukprot:CAMPEP_0179470136 /NCGR_PEP_ID=MMETSP0799-20121207/50647_1 /TAXON_ID=46947 /ORGANISM="Geminigera cryophila, Strain CCMP2564" /LENGTH=55 /DNA_ID=CAMNT_0021277007 /DNA_START=62 /DNA_END=225 /DNA_ORIENTATION=-
MSDVMSKAHAHELVQSYLAARSRIQEVEELLEEAVEGQLLYMQTHGWLFRSLAVV